MKKLFLIIVLSFNTYFAINTIALSGVLTVTAGESKEKYKKTYFAGGCFWCMEESFDKVKGVIKSTSGYSGGHLKNPTYKQVISKDTGHVEAITVFYDPKSTSYEKLLEVFWENIDPFDANGQFCDKGKSYRSVIFFENKLQKNLIDHSFKKYEKAFNKKIVTLIWKFDKFYPAENFHQDYYEKNFIRYLMYKKSCQREEILKKIWN